MTLQLPYGFTAEVPDFSAESDYRERTGKWAEDDDLPPRLRCDRCGWRGWGKAAATRHRKACKGPVPHATEFPPGPVWVDI